MNARLADDLQETVGASTLPVRTGDRVEIMRGDHAGATGRVHTVDTDSYRVEVEGVERESVDGSEIRPTCGSSNSIWMTNSDCPPTRSPNPRRKISRSRRMPPGRRTARRIPTRISMTVRRTNRRTGRSRRRPSRWSRARSTR
ncbi:MAG: 50S ribosomal protein L24 [Candidatus Nanohaloarchaea archaeon]